jgi:hypothetical protein
MAYIKPVSLFTATMLMERIDESYQELYLPNGGDVYGSDIAVEVTIDNPSSYYLELKLKEDPDVPSKGDMLEPVATVAWANDKNRVVVYP